uniref:FBA_2 domain-containing protein n=1 Tax=Steinernema glaseri TaxID=37863 RepID=A0A1I7ZS45_9BILA
MDSVPIRFCEDVFILLQWPDYQFLSIADKVPDPWKTLAKRFGANQQSIRVVFGIEHGEWCCWVEEMEGFGLQSLKELLAVDRRYFRCTEISVCEEEHLIMYNKICSRKEDITKKVIPFLNTIPQKTHLNFWGPRETMLAYLEIFRNLRIFNYIDLPYCGRESEDFLEAQLNNSPRLETFRLMGPWPNTEAVEKLFLRFFDSDMDRVSVIIPPDDLEERKSSLKVTLQILKAVFRSWYDLGNNLTEVSGPPGITKEEILSLPVPEGLRRSHEGRNGGKVWYVRWSKPNGSRFECFLTDSELCIEGKNKKNLQSSVEEALCSPGHCDRGYHD